MFQFTPFHKINTLSILVDIVLSQRNMLNLDSTKSSFLQFKVLQTKYSLLFLKKTIKQVINFNGSLNFSLHDESIKNVGQLTISIRKSNVLVISNRKVSLFCDYHIPVNQSKIRFVQFT